MAYFATSDPLHHDIVVRQQQWQHDDQCDAQLPTFSAVSVAAHTAVASPPRRGATLYLHFLPLASSKACRYVIRLL
jgi:hypothetical protein